MTPHRVVATDIVHAIPMAIVAGAGYLLAGSIPAGVIGSLIAGRFNAQKPIGLAWQHDN